MRVDFFDRCNIEAYECELGRYCVKPRGYVEPIICVPDGIDINNYLHKPMSIQSDDLWGTVFLAIISVLLFAMLVIWALIARRYLGRRGIMRGSGHPTRLRGASGPATDSTVGASGSAEGQSGIIRSLAYNRQLDTVAWLWSCV